MKMIWASKKASPQQTVSRGQFALWDFLKMFFAAVICGVVVSIIGAGLAVLLAQEAYANTLPPVNGTVNTSQARLDVDTSTVMQPAPGVLFVGGGCGSEADVVEAIERDWKVTINGKYIDVRVMQTFIMPDSEAAAAQFGTQLPAGARLLRLTAHTTATIWPSKVFDANSYEQLSIADLRKFSRRGLLIVQDNDGAISTEAIINVSATEAITVEYTYRITVDETPDTQQLNVSLANYSNVSNQNANQHLTRGTVWVEWLGKTPSKIVNVPSGAALEATGTRITGLSWSTDQLDSARRFQLAWSM